MCADIGAVAIVDDSVKYCTQCAESGMASFLFGEYEWNVETPEPLPGRMARVHGWEELTPALVKLAADSSPTK